MSIIIESKKKSEKTIKALYPDAIFFDVTSHATDDMVRFSPFYPHYGIPVPFMEGKTAACVEAVWQGLKVFEAVGADYDMFRNGTMKNIKRTVRRFGPMKGHLKPSTGELLSYVEARKQIYIPTYNWMLENKVQDLVKKLRIISKSHTVVLLDYNTNCDIEDVKTPLSHAGLIKKYIENC